MKGGKWLAPRELYEIEQMEKQHAKLLAACKSALWRMEQYNYSAMLPTIRMLRTIIAEIEGES